MVSLDAVRLMVPVLLVSAACSGSSAVSIPTAGDDANGPTTHDASLPPYGDTIGDASTPPHADSAPPVVDASMPPDANVPPEDAAVVVDASKPIDANVPDTAGPPLVRCGGGQFNEVQCYAATQTCCATSSNQGFTYGCVATPAACGGLPIGCARRADCAPGLVCCDQTSGGHETVSCVAANACSSGKLLCEPGECAAGQTCSAYGNGVPYSLCR